MYFTRHYDLFIHDGKDWKFAKGGNMSRGAALGLLNQFAMQYPTRLFCGLNVRKLIAEMQPMANRQAEQRDARRAEWLALGEALIERGYTPDNVWNLSLEEMAALE